MIGDQTAVALVLAAQDNEPDEELETRQLDLLGLPTTPKLRKLREETAPEPKGPGRPAGARNKRTLEMARFLLSRYTSPLEVLAQIATARVDELSASLGCTSTVALQEKRLAAIALLPYLHQKMPVSVDLTNRQEVYLTIHEGFLTEPGEDDITLTATVVETLRDDKGGDEGGGASGAP